MPWPVAAAIETRVSKNGFDPQSLEFAFAPEAKMLGDFGMMWRDAVQVDVPISVGGVAPGVELIPDAVILTFEGEDGSTWTSAYQTVALSKRSPGRGPATMNADVDIRLAFCEKVKQGP